MQDSSHPPALATDTHDDAIITSFFGTDGVAAALRASAFDVHEEVTSLISHLRSSDPKVSLRAHALLRELLRNVASSNGLIQKQEVSSSTTTPDGRTVRAAAATSRLASKVKEHLPNVLAQNHPSFAATYLPPRDPTTPH